VEEQKQIVSFNTFALSSSLLQPQPPMADRFGLSQLENHAPTTGPVLLPTAPVAPYQHQTAFYSAVERPFISIGPNNLTFGGPPSTGPNLHKN
jgi:hypothetical protein